jgi:pyruvate dehydrogenase E2 component (dihydrolipoamide acetyltransferase)
MTDIALPKLSDSMEEGTILTWLKADGETVAAGEELVEIETDKANMTYESPAAGTLAIAAAAGETLPVGAVIARVGAPVDAPAAAPAGPGAGSASAADGRDPAASAPAMPVAAGGNGDGHAAVAATPLARRIAAAHGVDLTALAGSGPRGRVTRGDVAAAAGIAAPAAAPASLPAAPAAPVPPARSTFAAPADPLPAAGGDVEHRELTRLQQVVARRMAEAKATVPEFQVETEVAMDAALALRAQLKAAGGDVVPSVNDIIVKASARALRAHPLANGSYKDGRFELHPRVNVGIAVAAQDALVVPTITDADTRSLGAIAAESRRLAERVRDGSVTPPELSGGTFTVSNLGMYGMTAIVPVINIPQAAILGVGMARAALARDERGEVVDRQLMTLTLTCDHRILYGADAAQFLATIRDLLEHPLRLA